MYVWIWPSVTVSARIWRFAGKKSRDCPRQSKSQRFSSFINLPCYGVPQNYLHSDGPSALFLVQERLIAGYLKQERIKGGLSCLKRRALCWSIIPQASQANNWQTAQLKPGSNFPPSYQGHSRRYCLRCPSDMRTEVAGSKDLRLSCCRRSYGMVELYIEALPCSTGGYVAGALAAYENQALRNRYLAYVST